LSIELFQAPGPVAISAVTPLQARKALRQAGLLDVFNATMSQASEEVREEWEYCVTVERHNPNIAAFANHLGLSHKQIDDLFTLASTL